MKWEYSCGAVVFTRREGQLLYVLVQEQSGAFSLPKGHMEADESELETARREILEETGLHVEFLEGFREQEEYALSEKPGTCKRVTYFLAESGDEPLLPQAGEIMSLRLLPYEQAAPLFRHEDTRRILTLANTFLNR